MLTFKVTVLRAASRSLSTLSKGETELDVVDHMKSFFPKGNNSIKVK